MNVNRRTLLAGAAGSAFAAGWRPRPARADTVLQIWTGYPELVPWYKAVSADFAKANAGVSTNVFSTTLREHEQKLNAAMPTGTGPDVFDVGTNITSVYADAGLIEPNSAAVDAYLKKNWIPQAVDHFTLNCGRQRGSVLDILAVALHLASVGLAHHRLGIGWREPIRRRYEGVSRDSSRPESLS